MPGWSPRLDWEHLQNWLPGVLGVFAAILLVVIAANSPTQTNSKPAEAAPSQSAAATTKGQTGALPNSVSTGCAPSIFRHRQGSESSCTAGAAAGRYRRRSCQTAGDA